MPGIQWTYFIPEPTWRKPLVTSYDMPGIQWTFSIPGPLVASYNLHAWDTLGIFYPLAFSCVVRHAWDTVNLFYPWALNCHIRHAWDTVGLFCPQAFSRFIRQLTFQDVHVLIKIIKQFMCMVLSYTYHYTGKLL